MPITNKRLTESLLIILIMLINVGCDQISKMAVRKSIDYNQEISVIKNRFILTKVENTGAFLSLGSRLPDTVKFILLTIAPMCVLLGGLILVIARATTIPKTTLTGACFVIGGGMGNIYDRLTRGSVTDFLHLDFGIFRTGIFNMADVSIMLGFFLIIFESLRKRNSLSAQ